MKNSRLVFVIRCSSLWLLIFGFNHVLVSAQTLPLSGLSSVLTAVLPHIPAKVLGLIQLSLLAKLLRQSRNRGALTTGANGLDDDRDGLIDEEDELTAQSERKSNVMIFLGKHNIQVSNHGLKKDEVEQCEDGCEEVVEDGNDEEEEEDNVDDNGGEEVDENEDEKDYAYKYKQFKEHRVQKERQSINKDKNKVTKVKNSGVVDVDKGEEDVDPEYYMEYKPMTLSYANSNRKPTKMSPMVPWNKKIMAPLGANTVLKNSVTSAGEQVSAEEVVKKVNLMSVPNGFPLKSPQSYTLKRSSNSDKKASSEAKIDHQLNNRHNYDLSDNEINELLSHPKVIEILRKLNESLFEDKDENKNKTKRQMKIRTKRQVINNEKQSFADENWRPIRSNRLRPPQQSLVGVSSVNSLSQYLPNYSIHSSSELQKSENIASDESNDSPTESNGYYVQYIEPKVIYESEAKPESTLGHSESKSSDSSVKSSSSVSMPLYYPMAVTDDDTYPMQLEMTKPDEGHIGHMGHIGHNGPHKVVTQAHLVDEHSVTYGGDDHLKQSVPRLPVIDLTYWTKTKKKKKKKKKKKSKKKYQVTTESPEDYDNQYEYEDYEERPVPIKKHHSTIQVIKLGKTIGNYGYGSESQDVPDWIRRLPGARGIFELSVPEYQWCRRCRYGHLHCQRVCLRADLCHHSRQCRALSSSQ